MTEIASYWATAEDKYFEAGHYVEAWELARVAELSSGVRKLLSEEQTVGNKIRSVGRGYVELAKPIGQRIWSLPDGVVFWCPLQEHPIYHYDGDEDGAVVCLTTGTRIFPTGYESQPPQPYSIHARSAA